jgi:hypothetical protein
VAAARRSLAQRCAQVDRYCAVTEEARDRYERDAGCVPRTSRTTFAQASTAEAVCEADATASRPERSDFVLSKFFARHDDDGGPQHLDQVLAWPDRLERRAFCIDCAPAGPAEVTAAQRAVLDFDRIGRRSFLPPKRHAAGEIARLQIHSANERGRLRDRDGRTGIAGGRCPGANSKREQGERYNDDWPHSPDHSSEGLAQAQMAVRADQERFRITGLVTGYHEAEQAADAFPERLT